MDGSVILRALAGGVLIGAGAALLLVFNGRIAGVSSIVGDVALGGRERGWKSLFIVALVAVGAIAAFVAPASIGAGPSLGIAIAAGLLVGAGTRLGSGCTSGHGVCGIGRFSTRSIVATLTFIATGAATVALVRAFGGVS